MNKRNLLQAVKRNMLQTAILLTGLCSWQQADAYFWLSPTHSQTTVGSYPTNPIINSANITYGTANINLGLTGQLGVISWDRSTTGVAGFYVFDDKGNSVTISGYPIYDKADVIIGNGVDPTGTSDYRVGIVYVSGGNIMLDVYDVTNAGTAGMAATLYRTLAITSGGGYDDPHIDIIEQVGVTHTSNIFTTPIATPLGLPSCSRFVVTYSKTPGVIYGYYNDLNFTVTPITSSSISGSGPLQHPDVAAIQMKVGGTVHDYARFTFGDNAGNVYEVDWDIIASSYSSPFIVLTASKYPRIDAIDDYNTNSSSTQANYEIVADGSAGIMTYNNLNIINITSPYLSSYGNNSSCVAAGPGSKYAVAYYTTAPDPITGAGGHILTQTINYSTGLLSNANYYQVDNASSWGSVAGATPHIPVCISASCNDGSYSLVSWCYNLAVLTYKYTPSGIAFKPSVVANATSMAQNISVFPNPATDHIQINDAQPGTNYTIADMSGKVVQQGRVTTAMQVVDIDMLPQGAYLLEAHTATGVAHTEFVKQ